MKHRLFLAFTLVGILPVILFGQEENKSLLGFYPTADSISEFPPLEAELAIICQKKIGKHYVTFIGRKDEKKIFIAAVTLKPVKDIKKEISLTVNFDGVKPNVGKVSTWGYVFDRNNDGKIDYMALIGGAGAFEGKNFPDEYPVRDQHLDMQQLELFVSHCKLIFNHWADDNFDDTLDAMVHIDIDPVRDWVKRKMVIRSTKFDGKFDDVWAFIDKITEDPDTVEHTSTSVAFRPIGKLSGQITKETLMEKTAVLQLLNRAAAQCGVTKDFNKEE
ncbi:MAG: hypothetical protein HYR76_01835 [Ignavibacteria bacterium]|nr:hypothetical protein [Ignavibacteria bacterium]MBI3765633.1 hypothetical protein [Ignavibacteriales bacterium]